jgi:hypothetical protein
MLLRAVSTPRKPADIYVCVLAAGFESLLVEPVWGEKEAIAPGDATGKNASQYPFPYINLNDLYIGKGESSLSHFCATTCHSPLRYMKEGHGFDSCWSHWNFSLT